MIGTVLGDGHDAALLGTLVPAGLVLVFLGSVLAGSPMTGLLVNRVVGGPRAWREHDPLMQVYVMTTLAGAAVSALIFAVQAVSYAEHQPLAFFAAQVVAVPVFAVLAVVTLVAARRAVSPSREVARSRDGDRAAV